ncbi:MAG: hypothetical protein LBQ20_08370 [Rhodanobacter sp.]|jgi:hypothetical protein|nr:hypothetical protein [Rhodanobacter sp.]
MVRLVDQIKEALAAFARLKTPPALIGGWALVAHIAPVSIEVGQGYILCYAKII